MSDSLGTPPVDPKYAAALANNTQDIGAKRPFMFRAFDPAKNVPILFNTFAETAEKAISTFTKLCDAEGWDYFGRVTNVRSAFIRAAQETTP